MFKAAGRYQAVKVHTLPNKTDRRPCPPPKKQQVAAQREQKRYAQQPLCP